MEVRKLPNLTSTVEMNRSYPETTVFPGQSNRLELNRSWFVGNDLDFKFVSSLFPSGEYSMPNTSEVQYDFQGVDQLQSRDVWFVGSYHAVVLTKDDQYIYFACEEIDRYVESVKCVKKYAKKANGYSIFGVYGSSSFLRRVLRVGGMEGLGIEGGGGDIIPGNESIEGDLGSSEERGQ